MIKNDKTNNGSNVTQNLIFSKNQINCFLPDKVDFTFYSEFIPNYKINDFYKNKYSIPNSNSTRIKKLKIKNVGGGKIIMSTTSFNFYRRARKYLKKELKISRTNELCSHDNNFIPLKYIQEMKKNNLTCGELRYTLYKKLWSTLEKEKLKFIESLNLALREDVTNPPKVFINFSHISVTNDFFVPHGVNFIKNNEIREILNSISPDLSEVNYKDNNGNTFLTTESIKETIDPSKVALRGRLFDGSFIIGYKKETSKSGELIRLERRLDSELLKNNGLAKIESYESLFNTLESLGHSWGKQIYNTLSKVNESKIVNRKKVIRGLCKQFFPKHYFRIYESLTKPPHTISTGKESLSPKSYFRKIRKMTNKNVFFKRIGRCYYVVNNEWLKNYINGDVFLDFN